MQCRTFNKYSCSTVKYHLRDCSRLLQIESHIIREPQKKKFIVPIVFPPLQKQQVLIGHNKLVVLIKQLTFSGNQPARLTGYTTYPYPLSWINKLKMRLGVSFNLPAKSFIPALFHLVNILENRQKMVETPLESLNNLAANTWRRHHLCC